jgi:hypothetical protein
MITVPRIQDNSRLSSADTPSLQSFSLKGTLDVTTLFPRMFFLTTEFFQSAGVRMKLESHIVEGSWNFD